jgi:hypothetical protein
MKARHIHTFADKFGNMSKLNEATEWLTKNEDSKFLFDNCPYIGILYVPFESKYNNFWYDGEDGDAIFGETEMLKLKVLEVDENNIAFVQYDDHHKQCCLLTRPHQGFKIKGNVII